MRRRLVELDWHAKEQVNKTGENRYDNIIARIRKNPLIAGPPIFITTTEDIGTKRCRGNHIDAPIHYCEEQIRLKNARAPL